MKNVVETQPEAYEAAKMDIIYLQREDVIVTSMVGEDGGSGDDDGWSKYY